MQRKSDRVRRQKLGVPLPEPRGGPDTDASDASGASDSELSTIISQAIPPSSTSQRHRQNQQPHRPAQSAQPSVGSQSTAGRRLEKRRRDVGNDSDNDEEPDQPPPKRPRSDKRPERTVHWNEVYGNGHPTYRHWIIEQKGIWYIIRCNGCGLHFGRNPLQQGIGHLNGVDHNFQNSTREAVIRELGHEVLGCNAGRKALNNNEFNKLLKANKYTPFDRRRQGAPCTSTINPQPGELYCTKWNNKPYVVMVLPMASFDTVGVIGNAVKVRGTPDCYVRDHDRLKWASGFEDGGKRVHLRYFPVMYFEVRPLVYVGRKLQPPSLDWKTAKSLRGFDWDNPESRAAKGYENAKQFFCSSGAAPRSRNAWNG